MAKNGAVLELSSVDVEEEDGEIELSLGLSIGGSFCKSAKFKPEEENSMVSREKIVSESANAGVDPTRENQCLARTSMAQTTAVGDSEPESGSECLDPQRKREVHALRRQEARKKRGEKLRKGIGRGVNPTNGASSDDTMWLEKQRLQIRVTDREIRENEAKVAERTCKREKNEVIGNKCVLNEQVSDLNLSLNHNGAQIMSHGPNAAAAAYGSSSSSSSPVPVVPVQFPYPPPLQFVPFASGCAYPCVMPCWNPPAGNAGYEKNFQQLVGCQSFRPYQGNVNSGQNPLMGSDSEHNSGKDGENRNAVSNGSPVCSSSMVSNHRSTSRQGGSTHSGSHSSRCKREQSQPNMAREQFGQSEQSVSCNQIESTQAKAKAANCNEKAVSSSTIHSPTKNIERINSETQPDLARKPTSSQNLNPTPSKVVSRDSRKPPKPETQSHNAPSFSQMPCVSTTGNGPNGKTITGFLYRYTKTEVSIICVCHGSSFSPAEFVEHAGGKDITHPLRHITVIPPAF